MTHFIPPPKDKKKKDKDDDCGEEEDVSEFLGDFIMGRQIVVTEKIMDFSKYMQLS